MKKIDKRGRGANAAEVKTPYNFTTIQAQRARLLEQLRTGEEISTAKARNELQILHPAGRVQELRQLGFEIDCEIVISRDFHGFKYRMGKYRLLAEPRKGDRKNGQ